MFIPPKECPFKSMWGSLQHDLKNSLRLLNNDKKYKKMWKNRRDATKDPEFKMGGYSQNQKTFNYMQHGICKTRTPLKNSRSMSFPSIKKHFFSSTIQARTVIQRDVFWVLKSFEIWQGRNHPRHPNTSWEGVSGMFLGLGVQIRSQEVFGCLRSVTFWAQHNLCMVPWIQKWSIDHRLGVWWKKPDQQRP